MEHDVVIEPRWPDHLLGLCRSVSPDGGGRGSGPERQAQRSAAWIGLRDALVRFLRRDARRFTSLSKEDLEDLASTKALELLSRAESGEWRLVGRSGPELAGYLARVARNALIDMAKQNGRFGPSLTNENLEVETENRSLATGVLGSTVSPESAAMAREFIAALRGCLRELQPRALRIWFYRAFYGMSTQEVAAHPQVGLRPPHVDVIVQRARTSIRSCLATKGLDPADMPPGTFVELWELLESLSPAIRSAVETGGESA
jgi:RNA polymerase sigma factor (sigma-70 family)